MLSHGFTNSREKRRFIKITVNDIKVRSQKANFLLIAFFVSVLYFLTNFTNQKSEDSMALWGGRFTQAADKRFKNFNDSLRFDYRLAEQDIEGSIGWSKALVSVNILTVQEQQQLEQALNELLIEVRSNPQAILQDDAEDIHSWVESKLIDKVGNLGKKLHTGRSRNDQVALDIKMWCKERVAELQHSLRELQRKLVLTAENNQEAVMPGYTHLQRAQPITFAHWCMAYVEMLDRDYSRLADA